MQVVLRVDLNDRGQNMSTSDNHCTLYILYDERITDFCHANWDIGPNADQLLGARLPFLQRLLPWSAWPGFGF